MTKAQIIALASAHQAVNRNWKRHQSEFHDYFWSRANVTSPKTCWEWRGSHSTNGYGQISVKDQTNSAHRVAYELAFGDIPKGIFVCHSCDNRSCVNPAHLFLGTNQENQLDALNKGRLHKLKNRTGSCNPMWGRKGEAHPSSKFTEITVKKIWALHGEGLLQREIAKELAVTQSSVSRILAGKTWHHVHPTK